MRQRFCEVSASIGRTEYNFDTYERVKPSGARSAFTIDRSVATTAAHAEDVKADSTKGKRRVKLPMFGQLRI